MFEYLKYGAIIGMTALGGAYVGLDDKAETEAVLAQYAFAGKDLERFNVCKVAMIKSGAYYDDSSDAGGCACTVAEVKASFPESQRDLAHDIDALDSYSTGLQYSEVKYTSELKKIASKHNVTYAKVKPVEDRVYKIISYCASGNSSASGATS